MELKKESTIYSIVADNETKMYDLNKSIEVISGVREIIKDFDDEYYYLYMEIDSKCENDTVDKIKKVIRCY